MRFQALLLRTHTRLPHWPWALAIPLTIVLLRDAVEAADHPYRPPVPVPMDLPTWGARRGMMASPVGQDDGKSTQRRRHPRGLTGRSSLVV